MATKSATDEVRSYNKVSIKEAIELLDVALDSDVPIHLWGPPGVGKSAIVHAVVARRNWHVVDLRMALLNPVDLRGLPVADLEKSRARFLPLGALPQEPEWRGVVFFDELNCSAPSVQASAYQLILDRRIGEYVLPKGARIVAAGNRSTDRAVVFEMPTPLRNRFVHLDVEASLDEWKDWAFSCGVDNRVVSFLNFKPDLLFKFDPKVYLQAFPTPRTWEMVSKVIKGRDASKLMPLLAGTVGDGPAQEFVTFCRAAAELPSAEAIIRDGKIDTPVPEKIDAMYALCGGLVYHTLAAVRENKKVGGIAVKNLFVYLMKVGDAKKEEFSILAFRDFARTPEGREFYKTYSTIAEWRDFCKRFAGMVNWE